MTITTFDKNNLGALRAELDAALKAVADAHGITLRIGTMRFDVATFSATVEGKAGDFGDIAAKQAVDMARAYGIDASAPSTHPARLGATLIEYRMKARAKPWVFAYRGQNFITNDAGIRAMFPKVAEDDSALPTLESPPVLGARA